MWEHELFLKFNMREASVHVPLLISVPGAAPGVRPELVAHIDLFPTICDLVAADCPDSVQGRSLKPLLNAESAPDDWRDAVFSQIGDVQMIRTATEKLNVYGGEVGEYFDLAADPKEFYNRIDDASCSARISGLLDRLRTWEETHTPNPSV